MPEYGWTSVCPGPRPSQPRCFWVGDLSGTLDPAPVALHTTLTYQNLANATCDLILRVKTAIEEVNVITVYFRLISCVSLLLHESRQRPVSGFLIIEELGGNKTQNINV